MKKTIHQFDNVENICEFMNKLWFDIGLKSINNHGRFICAL